MDRGWLQGGQGVVKGWSESGGGQGLVMCVTVCLNGFSGSKLVWRRGATFIFGASQLYFDIFRAAHVGAIQQGNNPPPRVDNMQACLTGLWHACEVWCQWRMVS